MNICLKYLNVSITKLARDTKHSFSNYYVKTLLMLIIALLPVIVNDVVWSLCNG